MFERLKKLCDSHNMSVTSLCVQVTGSSGNLSTWKKGYMRSDYLAKCAELLDVSSDYLLGRDKTPSPGLTENEQTIVRVFKELTDTQQGEIIGRAKMMAEQNAEEFMREGRKRIVKIVYSGR